MWPEWVQSGSRSRFVFFFLAASHDVCTAIGISYSLATFVSYIDSNATLCGRRSVANESISACGQVRCGVAGSSDLFLSLTAACAEAQPEPGALSFQAAVGSSETKLLTLSNVDGSTDWHIRPVIRNSQWSGPDTAAVPAGMESSYELTYKPITQSTQVSHPTIYVTLGRLI